LGYNRHLYNNFNDLKYNQKQYGIQQTDGDPFTGKRLGIHRFSSLNGQQKVLSGLRVLKNHLLAEQEKAFIAHPRSGRFPSLARNPFEFNMFNRAL
jgi:hypothetical protein